MSHLRTTLKRIAEMGWDEKKTRLSQAVSKRVDLARYLGGIAFRHDALRPSRTGIFFFAPSDLSGRISLLKKHTEIPENIIHEADEICHHRFSLLGYESLDYGNEIDWHLDIVHGKRAALKPWFKINFLDSGAVGDHKIIWELNRHQHLVTLAKAFRLTGDDRYVRELQAQWYSWQRANPYPMGINWASSLEVAFRSLSWIWVVSLLSGIPEDGFRTDIVRALELSGRHIEKYLSTYFSPNTHLLGEALALFVLGTACPELRASARWRELGWGILRHEAQRQVRPDGLYFEQSLYYHVYALDFFLHARVLAGISGVDIPPQFDLTINRMLDVVAALSRAGPAEEFGDDDGGRVFNPRRNRIEHMADPLAVGAVLFHRADLKYAGLTEEAIWLLGEPATQFFAESTPGTTPQNQAFTSGGLYIMASGGDRSQQMVIDAGPQGTGRSGHGHADALNVTVAVDGHRLLVDSGAFCYMYTDRDRFRGTAAHNTLRVDGLDQAIPDGPFSWSSIPGVSCDEWTSGKTFSFFSGSHNGYMRLPEPVIHRRQIFLLKDSFWLVRDVAEGTGLHSLELFWHFASDLVVSEIENGFLVAGTPGSPRLAVLPAAGSGWSHVVEANFVSPVYGRREKALTLHSSSNVELPTEHGTLLTASMKTAESGRLTRQSSNTSSEVSAYCYEEAQEKHWILFALKRAWHWEQWSTDATVLYFAAEGERITHFVFCGGTFVKFNGKSVLAHHGEIQRFEWQEGRIFSSDHAAAESFSQDAFWYDHSSAILNSGK